MAAPSQIPLSLGYEPQYGADSFFAGPSNRKAQTLIDRWPDWPAAVVVLTGPPGSGKTHLAQIWASRSGAAWWDAGRLGRGEAPLPLGGAVVEDIMADAVPEEALFHLINAAKEAGAS